MTLTQTVVKRTAFAIAAAAALGAASITLGDACVQVATAPPWTQAFVNMTPDVANSSNLRPFDVVRSQGGHGGGPGAVFADLNGDGYPEVYLMRGDPNGTGTWSANPLYVNIAAPMHRMLNQALNDAGVGNLGNSTGAVAADYDNDGDLDIYVLNYDQPNALYKNLWVESGGSGGPMSLSFIDVAEEAGVASVSMETGFPECPVVPLDRSLTAAWADVNRDGFADLYVGNHNGAIGTNAPVICPGPGQRDILFLNDGAGGFIDVTEKYGVTGFETPDGQATSPCGHTYASTIAVAFADLNNDRWPDLIVTNITHGSCDRDMIYINRGADEDGNWLGFELVTYSLNIGDQSPRAMGVAVGDFDNDGDLDIYITDATNFQNDLLINQLSETGELGFVVCNELPAVMSWGTRMEDFDNNGWLDIHVATQNELRDHLYMNLGSGQGFVEAAVELGVAQTPNSRGALSGDYNRDGWPDILVINRNTASALFENRFYEQHPEHGFLSITLKGDPNAPGPWKSTRDALGARVRVSADLNGDGVIGPGETQIREVQSGGSNAGSTSPLDVRFGLALAHSASVEILWPSGQRSAFVTTRNQFLAIDEVEIKAGDINGDGVVGSADLGLLLGAWGACPGAPGSVCPQDLDGDGVVGAGDLAILLGGWG